MCSSCYLYCYVCPSGLDKHGAGEEGQSTDDDSDILAPSTKTSRRKKVKVSASKKKNSVGSPKSETISKELPELISKTEVPISSPKSEELIKLITETEVPISLNDPLSAELRATNLEEEEALPNSQAVILAELRATNLEEALPHISDN